MKNKIRKRVTCILVDRWRILCVGYCLQNFQPKKNGWKTFLSNLILVHRGAFLSNSIYTHTPILSKNVQNNLICTILNGPFDNVYNVNCCYQHTIERTFFSLISLAEIRFAILFNCNQISLTMKSFCKI